MKQLFINTGWQVTHIFFLDDAKADAAYAALKEAMNAYEKFSNDKNKSVSIATDSGDATFRIEALCGVDLEDTSLAEPVVIEREVLKATIKAKVAARLAPAAA